MTLFRKIGWLFHRKRKEADLREELAFHIEEEGAKDLGNVTLIAEDTRAAWSWIWLEQFFQDLRYAARTMLNNKAFTILAAVSLALGIGANTAIYSFLDALLVRTLPVANPQSLVVLNWHVNKRTESGVVHSASGNFHDDPHYGSTTGIFPYPAFELLRDSNQVFSSLFAYHRSERLTLMIHGESDVSSGEYVSGNYFSGLGLAPAAGRWILDEDDRAGAPPVVVLSFAYARARFGDAAAAPGQPLRINQIPFTVAGVAPPDFFGIDPATAPDFYLPMHADLLIAPNLNPDGLNHPRYLDDHYYWIEIMGRLRPGVTLAQAQIELAQRFDPWVASTAENDEERKQLPRLWARDGAAGLDNLRRNYSQPMFILLTLVGLILAIACANIASLLLSRAAARSREIAVRLSMGAGRWRVIRQLLTESVWLAAIGGALGILFAVWGIQLLTALFGDSLETLRPALNWRVLSATAALTVFTGILFGLAPALKATRVDVIPALKESRGGAAHGHSRRLFKQQFSMIQALVVAQIALSFLLLIVAGLFVRTLSNLQAVDMGFHRDNVLQFSINARQAGHRDPEIISFYSDLQTRFAAIPGVRAATLADSPLIGHGAWGWPVVPAGQPKPEQAPAGHGSGFARDATHVLATGPGFFATIETPLLSGRDFDERDRIGSLPVAIVNEAWARVNFEGRNPVGQHVTNFGMDDKPHDLEIVGLARNTRYDDLTGAFPAIVYMAYAQNLDVPVDRMTFFLRTAGDPLNYVQTIRDMVRRTDARIPLTDVKTQVAQIEEEMTAQVLFARLCSGFALLALLIACVGLYGTMSYGVARRTGEIGIRMALGAPRIQVVWMVMRQVVVIAAIGLAIGVPVAYGSSRVMQSMLYGINASDWFALAVAIAAMLAVVMAAGYAPARRASRIDPMIALRHE